MCTLPARIVIAVTMIVMIVLLGGLAIMVCEQHNRMKSVSDTQRPKLSLEDLRRSQSFNFLFGQGGPPFGYTVLRLDGKGVCRYTFECCSEATSVTVDRRWKCAEFQVNSTTVDQLYSLLIDTRFFSLDKEYYEENMADGDQWILQVRCDGVRKSIHCSNYFPEKITRIDRFVKVIILQTHDEELREAKTVNGPDNAEGEFFRDFSK